MTDDHHGRRAGRATLLVRAADEILGTHRTINLNWAELAAGDPDAEVVTRDLVAAVVGSLPSPRDRAVLTQRLGTLYGRRREDRVKFCSRVKFEHGSLGWGEAPLALDGDAPLTLQSIGERMGITRERVRQLQDRALERMCRPRVPPGVRQYARQAIANVLNQAESVGVETGESLLTLAEAALPAVPVGLAAQVPGPACWP
jgi:uncharacterized protein (UPF0147 family)